MMTNIVLADGHTSIRSALKLLLESRLPVRVVAEAADMESLKQVISVSRAMLLLVDWELPGFSQEQGLKKLRELYPALTIVVLSVRPEVEALALAFGAQAFVAKSKPPEMLLNTVARLQCKSG